MWNVVFFLYAFSKEQDKISKAKIPYILGKVLQLKEIHWLETISNEFPLIYIYT